MQYFLIVYDRRAKAILERHDYAQGDRMRALEDRRRLVLANRVRPDVEVVLFGGDSFNEIRKTHARYFQTAGEIAAAR